ncbi:hypothetical protein [Kitasatospora sp. NPDC093806]|uniref:hypothetical protein n=1 Tax=Kitasatospora sp. NPDC093806 TaxID=3155075 RepID=UPI00342B0950
MRAKHATNGPEPARRTVGGTRRTAGRWLPRPRAVAAGGALLAQLWGFGAPGAFAAGAEPLPEPVSRTVGRALTGAPAGTGTGSAPDGPSSGPSGGPGASAGAADRPHAPQAGPEQEGGRGAADPTPSPGLLGSLTGATPGLGAVPGPDAATASVGGVLQDRIRAGGLPLPGQRAAVPDAFAIASGLLDAVPAQSRAAESRTSGGAVTDGPSAAPGRTGGTVPRSGRAGGEPHGPAAPPPAPGVPEQPQHAAADHPGLTGGEGADGRPPGRERASAVPGTPTTGAAAPDFETVRTTAAATVANDVSGRATAVLAPIAAGLVLTGAAMYKHRGLPKGH